MKRNSRLQHTALVLALAAAYPIVGHGAAGTTQFASGEVTYKRGNAAPAALTKGTTLESGDAITTGSRGIAQVKFSDGGYVAIQPNSQFDITRYADNGNAQQDSFLVNLARGGMRAITGLIGKRNTANYKVTTNTATVGIRGSSFTLAYGPNGEIIVTTEQDGIEVCTTAGCTGLTAGESAIVTSPNSEPSRTNATTTMPLVPYRQDPQVAGNQANEDGTAAIIGARLTGSYDMAFAWSGNVGEGGVTSGLRTNGQLHFGDNGAPAKHVQSYGEGSYTTEYGFFAAEDAATVFTTRGSSANSDLMVLGLWTNASEGYRTTYEGGSSFSPYNSYSPLAFVAGQVTPEANLASLNMSATYTLSASTPVLVAGGYGNGTLDSATLAVNFFGSEGNSARLNMNMTLPGAGGSSSSYAMSGNVYGEGSYFDGHVSTGEGAYPASANAGIQGFFGGQRAQWAGLSYDGEAAINNGEGYSTHSFGGSAILGRTGESSLGTRQLLTASGYEYDSDDLFNETEIAYTSGSSGAIDRIIIGNVTGTVSGSANQIASIPLEGGTLSLTHWANSSWTGGYNSYDLTNYVFVAGAPTSDSYIGNQNRTATYTLADGGASSPVYSAGGGTMGSLDSATMTVDFSGGSHEAMLDMSFTLTGTYAGTSTFSHMVYGEGNYFSGSGSLNNSNPSAGGSLRVLGSFYGTAAQFAGLSYYSYNRSGSNFHGAAILAETDNPTGPILPDPGSYPNLASAFSFADHIGVAAATGSHVFGGTVGNSFLSSINDGAYNVATNTTHGQFGHAGSSDGGDFIGWGKWESADVRYSGTSVPGVTNVHYVTGIPTTQDNLSALNGTTASYSVTGSTTPTSSVGGQTGVLVNAQLQVDFSLAQVSAAVTTKFGNDYVLGGANGMAITSNNQGNSFSGSQNGSFSGLFTGPGAERAGLVYNLNGGGTYGTVSGAIGFHKDSTQQPPLQPPPL